MNYLHLGNEFELGLFILFLIPFIFLHFRKTRFKHFIISFVILSSFIAGSLQLIGLISVNLLGLIRDFFILLFFVSSLSNSYNFKWGKYVLILFAITFFSLIINQSSYLRGLLFIRQFLFVILFLWALINTNISIKYYNLFKEFIIQLFLIQIFANIWKYIISGEYEKVVGSMSISEGSLTTIVSLIGVSFSLLFYLYYRKNKYLLVIIGFMFFAYVGRKRAVAVMIPLILVLTSLVYNKYFSKRVISSIFKIISIVAISLSLFYVGIRTFSFLNQDDIMWGEFNLSYTLDKSYSYLGLEEKERSEEIYFGRFGGYIALKEVIIDQRGIVNFLIGNGPGILLTSQLIDGNKKAVYVSRDLFDIDVGSRMGFTWLTLQIGALGAATFFFFFFSIFRYLKNILEKYKVDIIDKLLLTGIQVVFYIFIFDFFFYSSTMIRMESITFSLMFFVGYFIAKEKYYKKGEII